MTVPEGDPDQGPGSALPRGSVYSHLKALRRCLIVSLAAAGAAFLVIFFGFSRQLMEFLESPLKERGIALVYITLYEPIAIQMKASFITAVIAASPVIIAQLWSFLKPALYPRESRTTVLLFLVTLVLFLAGALFAYLIVFQMAVNFFLVTAEGIASPFISVEKYVGFLFSFILPFGLIFEVPVAMGILAGTGIVNPALFVKARRYVILLIFIVAAILTPPDVVSQILLALPLVVLFEAGIVVSRIMYKKRENP
ncbi:MAG: twin-arginine translocase subunit TatC [Treponema sp.]|jgi:sec-independent protein translocase protein TatC|nr:twin-arginine translocase subunit TatC [Treponema sp.]